MFSSPSAFTACHDNVQVHVQSLVMTRVHCCRIYSLLFASQKKKKRNHLQKGSAHNAFVSDYHEIVTKSGIEREMHFNTVCHFTTCRRINKSFEDFRIKIIIIFSEEAIIALCLTYFVKQLRFHFNGSLYEMCILFSLLFHADKILTAYVFI